MMFMMLVCRYPSLGDDRAGCIPAHCSGKRSVLDLGFPCSVLGALEIIMRFDSVTRAAKSN